MLNSHPYNHLFKSNRIENNFGKKLKTDTNIDQEYSKSHLIPLIPIEYKNVILPNDVKAILGSEAYTTNEIKNKYKCIMYLLSNTDMVKLYEPIIQLPNLCLSRIDNIRFKFDDHLLIKMVKRKIVYEYLNDFVNNHKKFFYLYGLKGIGKSFIIYHMVAELMKMKDKYRVVYINQADELIIYNSLRILKSIILYDCDDDCEFYKNFNEFKNMSSNIEIKTFMEDDNSIKINVDYLDALTIIEKINKFYHLTKNITVLFVFDQINIILSKLENRHNQYSFIDTVKSYYNSIISASANNNIKELKQDEKRVPPIAFDLDEFYIFRSFNENAKKMVNTEKEAKQIISMTGGIPLELNRFFQNKGVSLDDLMLQYEKEFQNAKNPDSYSNDSIKEWFLKLDAQTKEIAVINIARCIYQTKLDSFNCNTYDKRIFSLNELNILKPFSCLAMECVLKYYSFYLNTPLINEFQSIIKSNSGYSSSTVGNCIEVFIIQSLCTAISHNPEFFIDFKVNVKGLNEIVFNLKLKSYNVKYFSGYTTPSIDQPIDLSKSILYVPMESNYPGYDFFYHDIKQKAFYCFQVTTQKNPMDHVIQNDNMIYSESKKEFLNAINSWINYLPSETQFYEIWMLDRTELEINQKGKLHVYQDSRLNRLNQMNIIYFDEIEMLPELADYFKNKHLKNLV